MIPLNEIEVGYYWVRFRPLQDFGIFIVHVKKNLNKRRKFSVFKDGIDKKYRLADFDWIEKIHQPTLEDINNVTE